MKSTKYVLKYNKKHREPWRFKLLYRIADKYYMIDFNLDFFSVHTKFKLHKNTSNILPCAFDI